MVCDLDDLFVCLLLFAAPTLTISTNIAVTLVGDSVQVSCIPSDPMAPVQWSSSQTGEGQVLVTFSPRGLEHTAEFVAYEPSYRTELYTCDLINVDDPDQPVDPQMVSVRVIPGEL